MTGAVDRRGDAVDLARTFVRLSGVRILLAALLIAGGALVEGVGLLLLVPLLGLLLAGGGGGSAAALTMRLIAFLPGSDQGQRLLALLIVFAGIIVVRGLVLTMRDAVLARLLHGFIEAVRLRVIGRIAAAPWQRVARLNHARVVQSLGPDVQQIGVATHFGLQATVAGAMLAANCVLAIALAPATALIAIVLLVPIAVGNAHHLRRARRLGTAVIDDHLRMTDDTIRFLNGLKLAAAQNLQSRFVRDYRAASEAVVAHRIAFVSLQARAGNLATSLAALAGAVIVLLGIVVFRLDPAVLIAFVLILSRMSAPALMIQQSVQQIGYSLPAYRAVRVLEAELGRIPAAYAETRSVTASPVAISLDFDDVTFLHDDVDREGSGGVRRVSAVLPAGALIGIAGASGSGKTTFVDLAVGLIAPQTGTILANRRALTGADLDRHRDGVAYAGQDPVLFGDTVRRNLLWSAADTADEAIWDAIERVDAGDFVRRLAGGLDASIGERGVAISAGERQRLALARALLRRAPLIVLDEATSSIDIASERRIFARLRTITPRPTILLVSHRAESLAPCDRVLTFSAGALVEDRRGPQYPETPISHARAGAG